MFDTHFAIISPHANKFMMVEIVTYLLVLRKVLQ